MFEGKIKRKFRRRTFNPITSYLLLTVFVIVLSGILSLFNFQTTYNIVDNAKLEYVQVNATIENLFSFDGLKYIVGNATKMFISFAPLSMFLIASIGLAIAEASGFMEITFRRIFSKLSNNFLTFLVVLVATISSLINEVGFVILIPLAAYIYKAKKRNPMVGICAAFAGCAFGYGTSVFVGSLETQLIPFTTNSARMIDPNFHVSLLSNLYIMIISTIVLAIVGTVIIEKIIAPKLGKYRVKKQLNTLEDFEIIGEDEQEQKALTLDYNEKKGFKAASIVSIIFILFFIYSVIPGLPGSGLLLDYSEDTYLKQIFGDNSYFQDGFAYMISLLFIVSGLVYGFVSKKFKNNTDMLNSCKEPLAKIGTVLLLLFVASQFIGVFKKTNIGTVIAGICANALSTFSFTGIIYLLIAILIMCICDFFLTGVQAKWIIFSPVVVPALMRSNITPQFTQFVMRAVDSMTNGVTPLYAYFVIFIGYMNVYNMNEDKPVTISAGIKIMLPYFLIISLTWLLLLIGWYIIGLPIGPGVYPTV